MFHGTRKFGLGSLLSGGVLLWASGASAWESAAAEQSSAHVPRMPAAYPFGYSFGHTSGRAIDIRDGYFSFAREFRAEMENGGLLFNTDITHSLHGGIPGAPSPDLVPGLFMCTGVPEGTLENCRPATFADTPTYPWLNVRKAWDDDHSEHAQLSLVSARLAGLPESLAKPFFVRYPSENSLIASPIEGEFVVGQRWRPIDFASVETHALRGFSLYELSQLPDHSYSVSDWAAGNEVCPLTDIDGVFAPSSGEPDPGNLPCHDYARTLGILNVSHFAPGSRSVHAYYHDLAIQRMLDCRELDEALQSFALRPSGADPLWAFQSPEVRECEMEALVYEMFAQHFLQDAWATGHMWHRWGFPEFSQFPATLNERWGQVWDTSFPPSENVPGRRALIAALTATVGGTIHGAKGVLVAQLRKGVIKEEIEKLQAKYPFLPDDLDERLEFLTNDPLSGPFYLEILPPRIRRIEWAADGVLSAPGAGDFFLNEVLNPLEPAYDEQRKRLLTCTALSMRQVYEAGPGANGPLDEYSGPELPEDFDFDTYCWSQRATNASMYAAVSVAPVMYNWDGQDQVPDRLKRAMTFANKMIFDRQTPGVRLPNAADAGNFLANLEARMMRDSDVVATEYALNLVIGGRDATQSARNFSIEQSPDGTLDIRYLGLRGGEPLENTPPASYMDQPSPRGSEESAPQDYHTRNLFWRSHITELCEEQNVAPMLRDRCIASANEPGSDPDACTACIAVAELHVPTCPSGGLFMGPSKCQALGIPGTGGLPAEFFGGYLDYPYRDDCPLPRFYTAFHYCTGTSGRNTIDETVGTERLAYVEQNRQPACDQLVGYGPELFGTLTSRVAVTDLEGMGTNLVPLASVLVMTQTNTLQDFAAYCSSRFHVRGQSITTSLDDFYQAAISPMPLWATPHTIRTLDDWLPIYPSPHLNLEYCQVKQRQTFFNRSCAEALPAVGFDGMEIQDGLGYSDLTGKQVQTSYSDGEPRCTLREPRTFKVDCQRGFCSASGVCSGIGPPRVERWH